MHLPLLLIATDHASKSFHQNDILMGKTIVITSGLLAIATWFGAEYLFLLVHASPLVDFALYACFPFFVVVFLVSLFIVRVRHPGAGIATRRAFFVLR
ncbi:MAG TPA: hypothetical protein VGQ51_05155, partial [Puia sp.]|nr:hypothetical protein [Puia sp.]